MKRAYEKPTMEVECFEANEYVAACYDVSASCNIYSVEKDQAEHNGQTLGYVTGSDGLWHGTACQNNTFVYSDTDMTGWENGTGHTISNVNVGAGTWNSSSQGLTYTHTGTITITQQDPSRPNHS